MLMLYTFPAGFGQFSLSPFCVKAAALLKLSGLDWARRDLDDPRHTRADRAGAAGCRRCTAL